MCLPGRWGCGHCHLTQRPCRRCSAPSPPKLLEPSAGMYQQSPCQFHHLEKWRERGGGGTSEYVNDNSMIHLQ